ncbi:MAG: hypothetical protein HY755_01125 [Nitrospirae bacterium]|nr:hypothetical protein [Nitrospirota bacterium]
MLNELVELYDALNRLRCDFSTPYPYFRKCPKGKAAFCVYLDEYGKVSDISALTEFKIDEVYRWQEDNHTPTFPAFNVRALFEIPDPLPAYSSDNEKGILSFIEDLTNSRTRSIRPVKERELSELTTKCNGLWRDDMAWLGKCLKDTPDTIKKMIGEIPKPYQVLEELIKRSQTCEPAELQTSVCSILMRKLIETGEKVYAEALFVVKDKGKKKRRGKEHGKDFLYLLTIEDWNKYPLDPVIDKYHPNHPVIQNWMRTQFESHSESHYVPTGQPDAYGRDSAGAVEIFSPLNVGGFGPIVPFAANSQIPCLSRYGLEGSSLFPAGSEIRKMAAKGMDYILNQKFEGITWKSLTKYEPKKNSRKTVVFAYCTELKDANALQFFDRETDEFDKDIYRSEAATKLGLTPFDGVAQQKPDAKIAFYVMAAVDRGNTKILASRKYTLAQLIEGASHWQIGNANIPSVSLPWITLNKKKGDEKKTSTRDAIPIYPVEAIKLFNSDWDQDGTLRTQSRRFTVDEALDFLFEGDEVIGQRIEIGLTLIVEKTSNVIISAALKARHDYQKTGAKIKFKDISYLHMLPSLYGLLLFKKGIRKEDYMNENLFYLGRYFAVVDDLYIQYHMDVRSGSVPMSLLGNDNMKLALQNPLEAFLTLSSRLAHPYLSWAKRVSTDEKPGQIAKNCIRRIAELTDELSKAQLPTEINDAAKAKLLLGYLSCEAKKDDSSDGNN